MTVMVQCELSLGFLFCHSERSEEPTWSFEKPTYDYWRAFHDR